MQKSIDLKLYILSYVQIKYCDNQIQRTCDELEMHDIVSLRQTRFALSMQLFALAFNIQSLYKKL